VDQVFISDLMVRGIIGVSDRERSQPQDIVVNVTMFTDIRKGGETDSIDDCVNYRTVAKAIIKHIQEVSRFTVEALSEDVASICLANASVKKVLVRVEKPGAVRFSRSVGVEIEREQTE
jgi:FolB domain-containing protein